jgi:type II secretion system protein G
MKLTLLLLSIISIIFLSVGDITRDSIEDREHRVVEIRILFLALALDNFAIDMRRLPSMEEGLSVLVYPPKNHTKWKGPYISPEKFEVWGKKDIWGTEYIYIYPSQSGEGGYDLYSCGKNQTDDFGEGDDITSWKEIDLNYYDDHRYNNTTQQVARSLFVILVVTTIFLFFYSWYRKRR